MTDTSLFDTVTMARVYEEQGNDKEALRILEHLLFTDPENTDLKEARDRVKARMIETTDKKLTRLFEEWVELLLTHQRIQQLKQMNNLK